MSIYSIILSFLMIFASIFAPFMCSPDFDASDDDFIPVMRFVATSDTHIIALGDKSCHRINNMIESSYALAALDKDYGEVDAFVFCGDITDDGTFTAFSAFAATTDRAIKDGTERLAVVAKSHDGNTYDAKSLEIFSELTGQETDFHRVINGIHFIGVSRAPADGVHYSEEQVKWLDAELKKATEAAPDMPVFVFQHEHVLNTVFGSYSYDGWGMDTFTEVLNKYPQAVHISGHSHYPANDPRSIWQGSFTAIGDGGLAYYEFTVDDETSVHPKGYKAMTQALMLEVDEFGRVLIKVMDIDAGEIVKEYLVDNITETVKTKYSHDERRENSAFSEEFRDFEVSVKNTLGKKEITVKQNTVVKEDNAVYLYRLFVYDENGELIHQDKVLSGYYYAKAPEKVSFGKVSLPDNAQITVVAEDIWGNRS